MSGSSSSTPPPPPPPLDFDFDDDDSDADIFSSNLMTNRNGGNSPRISWRYDDRCNGFHDRLLSECYFLSIFVVFLLQIVTVICCCCYEVIKFVVQNSRNDDSSGGSDSEFSLSICAPKRKASSSERNLDVTNGTSSSHADKGEGGDSSTE